MVVNQKELAQCLGISARQVRYLRDEGLFKTVKGNRGYVLETCIQEYINFKVNAEMGRSASVSIERIKADHENIKKDISALKLRRMRKELHEAADVEAFLSDMLTRFKKRLLSLPSKIAMQIAGEKDTNVLIQVLTRGFNEVLEELSGYDPDSIDGEDIGQFDIEDDEEDEP